MSQPLGELRISTPPGLPQPAQTLTVSDKLLTDWLEDEVLQHFDLIQAQEQVAKSDNEIQFAFPVSWEKLEGILKRIGYMPFDVDHWRALGFAMFDGPDPTETTISSRARTAAHLCDLAAGAAWSSDDIAKAKSAADKFNTAARKCEEELKDVLRERRKLKIGKLLLWKELGNDAIEFIKGTAPGQAEYLLTQWSTILDPSLLSAPELMQVRDIASMAEKGDEKIWDMMKGQEHCYVGSE